MAKILTNPQTILNVVGLNAETASESVEWGSYYGITVQITVANQATFAGGAKLQWSHNDLGWVDFPTADYSVPTLGADGTYGIFYKFMVPAKHIRLVVTRSAGSADVSATWMATKI